MKEIKQFRGGGLDKDSAYEDIAPNDVAGGYNVRFTGTEEGEEGYATDIESNEPIAGVRPAGINKCIGAFGFETVRKGYAYICNSFGFNQITELDYDTKTETVLFTNKTDSGGEDIMPLDPQYYINDMKLLQDKFAVFTDSRGEVYYINLERLKSGELGVITQDDIRLVKAPSLITPTAFFCDDQSRSVNLLKGNLFQFAVQYVYLDGERSTLSSYSERPVNPAESTPVEGTDVGMANNLVVTVDAGSNRVKTINIYARIGLLDFMLIKTIERSEVITLTSDTFPAPDGTFARYDPSISGIYEIYNPATNKYGFAFYNDGLYTNADVLETDLMYDHVPQKAGTLELLNGNVLALGDLTEGYARPTVDVSLTQTAYDPNIAIVLPEDTTILKIDSFTSKLTDEKSDFPYVKVQVTFSGIAQSGDKFSFVTENNHGLVYERPEIVATVDEDGNTEKFIKKIVKELWGFGYPASYEVIGGIFFRLTFTLRRWGATPDEKQEYLKGAPKITLALAGTSESKSIASIKTNSSYQLALGHKDRYGRLFPIVTDKRFILKTQSLAQLEGQIPRFNWTINQTQAPTGAESYQWLISENTTHQSNLYVNAVLDTTNTDADYLVFKLNTLQKFNTNNLSSILAYDYSAGDRCTFVSMQPATGDKIWFNDPKVVDVEVVGYTVKVTGVAPDPIVTDYLLKVRKSSIIDSGNLYNGQTIAGRDILLEIYTPKKRTSTVEGTTTYNSTLFYEIGEEFPIVNGNYTQVTGDIDSADVYYKTRQLVNSTDENDLNVYEVEDFHFSDFYQSNYTSYGRARTYEDETGVKHLKACIRYSDESREGDNAVNLSRFYLERIYGFGSGQSSAEHGAINKMVQRDNYLVIIQETKVGHAPIYAHILEDNEGAQNVAISDKILGSVRYISSGNYGMGGAKESFAIRQDGTIYFIDPNNSLPIRDGRDGVKPIGQKMSKYFKRVIQQARNAGKKMIGFYDNLNDEYILSIEGLGDIVTTIAFSASDWSFADTYTVDPSTLLSTGTSNGTVDINISTGKAIFTPTTDYVGNGGFAFSFVNDGITVNKNSCGVITAGSKVVDDFVFADLVDKELSTVYESNTILINGNDIASPISITGGEYQINSGSWTSSAGTVVSGDTVKVRLTSSASELTTANAILTVFDKSDTFSVATKDVIYVPVNYSVAYGVDPITQNGLIFTKNGVEIIRFGSEGSGTLTNTFAVGDLIGIRQFSYFGAYPWETPSNANLTVKVNTVERFNGNITVQATELQADSFVIAEGTTLIDAIAVGSSAAVGYVTKVLNVTSNTTLAKATVIDTTPPKTVLEVTNSETGFHVYPYNLFADANTQSLRVDNLSGVYTLDITVNGGGVVTIPVGSFTTVTGIVKDSIDLTLTLNTP